MTTTTAAFAALSPFDLIPAATPPETILGGDLAIGSNLADWVSGSITADDIRQAVCNKEQAYLPLVAIYLNGWTALRRMQTSLLHYHRLEDLETASRYTCPYSNMDAWGLVPLGVLTTDPALYQKAFADPGAWAYVYDQAIGENRSEFVNDHLGDDETAFESMLHSVAITMLGSGYTVGCRASDGNGTRTLVTVDFANGDKLICAAWTWYNN